MTRSILASFISLLSGNRGVQMRPAEEVEPLYRSYAFPTVPSNTDRLFDEADRRTNEEKPLRVLGLPVL
ncbi:hypothetical protein LCGC14_0044680 [marine sediment metagenome]|uniref:Uncharacterized protein n=1 Tax=marine sediment metagenome TaxID=412755 RepID=A0A0F9W898_9ZZZZ